ncbi:MAG: heavy-metal-associated domain-containing protein [Gallionellaceae bacterium]|nr:heavy-metal-associated domain-containing protein [Gallionellaceae bacterium]
MNMTTITLKIGGMSCMGCVNSVKRLLEPLPGVSRVDVDLANGSAEIDYDSAQVDPAVLRRTVSDGGYPVAD